MSNNQPTQSTNPYMPRTDKEKADIQKRFQAFADVIQKAQARLKVALVPELQADERGIVPVQILKNVKAYGEVPKQDKPSGAPKLTPIIPGKKKNK